MSVKKQIYCGHGFLFELASAVYKGIEDPYVDVYTLADNKGLPRAYTDVPLLAVYSDGIRVLDDMNRSTWIPVHSIGAIEGPYDKQEKK